MWATQGGLGLWLTWEDPSLLLLALVSGSPENL